MSRGRETRVAVAASLLLLAFHSAFVSSVVGFVHKPRRCLESDQYRYIDMASAPPGRGPTDRSREAPFCYRVLVPGLVHLLLRLGVPTDAAFYALANLFLLGYLLAFHRLLRVGGASPPEAILGLALVGLVPGAVRWYEYQYWMPDPACLFLLTLAVLFIRTGRERPLLAISPVAALCRETYLLALPYAFLHAWRRGGLKGAAWATVRLGAVTLPVYLLLHEAIAAKGGVGLRAAAGEMLAFRARHLWDNQIYFATLGSFGVLLPLALLRPRGIGGFARRHPEDAALLALAYLSLSFANNTDRLLAYALPALVPAALRNLRLLSGALGAKAGGGAALAAVLLQAFFYWRTPFHELGISIYQPTDLKVTVSLVGFWLVGAAVLERSLRAADAHPQPVDPLARGDEQ